MIRSGRAGPVEDVEFAGAEDAVPTPEVLEALATPRRDRDRAVEPRDLDRADARRAGLREALRDAAPVVAVSPLVRGAGAQGPDRRVHGLGGPRRSTPTGSPRTTTGCSTASWPTSAPTRCRRSRPTSRCPTPPARRRVARETLDFALALGSASVRRSIATMRTVAVLPVKSFGRAKQRLGAAVGAARPRRARRRDGRRRARGARRRARR